tara:strand:+ start:1847 stop:2293 length:447 start_codon:yes stop_codon:yes gene_type:complete
MHIRLITKLLFILLFLNILLANDITIEKNNCSRLGEDFAKEQSYSDTFDYGLTIGFVTFGILYSLPAHSYRKKYLQEYNFDENNFENINFKEYGNEVLCKEEFIKSYNLTSYEIRKKTYTKGVLAGSAIIPTSFLLVALIMGSAGTSG